MSYNPDDHKWQLEHKVIVAGGKWVGIQDSLLPGEPALVLFNSTRTNSTLALPDDEFFTVSAVHDKIAESDKLFENAPVRVSRRTLRLWIETLKTLESAIQTQLEK